jgi:hypothetical protein
MPSAGFETTIAAGERLQTHALDRSATGIGWEEFIRINYQLKFYVCSEALKALLKVIKNQLNLHLDGIHF